jgi:hypothetical protein
MTLYFLPDINAASAALLNIFFLVTLSYSVSSFVFDSGLKIIGYGNPDNNLESLYILIVKNIILWYLEPSSLIDVYRRFEEIG